MGVRRDWLIYATGIVGVLLIWQLIQHQELVGGMLGLAPHRGTILAIQCDVEHAGAQFGQHVSLQRQAFAHAQFNTAVVVADRQRHSARLGTQQDLSGMCGGQVGHVFFTATMNIRGNASRRLPSARTG